LRQVTETSVTHMPLGSAGLLMMRVVGGIAGRTDKHKSTV